MARFYNRTRVDSVGDRDYWLRLDRCRIHSAQKADKRFPGSISRIGQSDSGRDNSGKMIASVHNYYEAPEKQPPPLPHPLIQNTRIPLPVLRLDFSEGSVHVSDAMVAFVDSGGQCCHSIRVHNKEAAIGEEAHRATAISARLTFKSYGSSSRITSVDRACWIGNIENEIYLQPGDTKQVLLGIPNRDSEWVTYHNPNQFVPGVAVAL